VVGYSEFKRKENGVSGPCLGPNNPLIISCFNPPWEGKSKFYCTLVSLLQSLWGHFYLTIPFYWETERLIYEPFIRFLKKKNTIHKKKIVGLLKILTGKKT